MSEQVLKTPLEIRGFDFSPENIKTLELAAELVRSLSISMGRTDHETVPIRVDREGHQHVRPFDRTACTAINGLAPHNTEVDLGDVYNYLETACYIGAGYVDVGQATGVYPWRVQPFSITGLYGVVASKVYCIHRFYGSFRFIKWFDVIGETVNTSYSAYKFPGR